MSLPPLRGYQQQAIDEARRCFGHGASGVLIQAPTGAGKTRMAQEVALAALAKRAEQRILWLAHRVELIDQPAQRLREIGVPIRVIRADESIEDPDARISVASVQTLARRRELPPADLVVFDEARHYSAPLWSEIAATYASAKRIGLDATPDRPLRHLFDALVSVSSDEELTRDGFLTPVRTIAPASRVKELARDPVEAYFEFAPNSRAIYFCSSVGEAERLTREFTAAGVAAAAIHQGTDVDRRREALASYCAGDGPRVLCNVFCLTEGTDLPPTECVAVYRTCSSESAWVQMVGRGRRPSPATGKTGMTLIDPFGLCHQLGLPEDPRTWGLDGEAPKRTAQLPPAVQCRQCLGWSRGSPCPSCGATKPVPPPQKVRWTEMNDYRKSAASHDGEQRWRALQKWADRERAAGRSAWRAKYIYKGVYGSFPPDDLMRRAALE